MKKVCFVSFPHLMRESLTTREIAGSMPGNDKLICVIARCDSNVINLLDFFVIPAVAFLCHSRAATRESVAGDC